MMHNTRIEPPSLEQSHLGKTCFGGLPGRAGVKNPPANARDAVDAGSGRSLGQEDSPEEEWATHSNVLAWIIPRTEERGGLRCMGVAKSQGRLSTHIHTNIRSQSTRNEVEHLLSEEIGKSLPNPRQLYLKAVGTTAVSTSPKIRATVCQALFGMEVFPESGDLSATEGKH